MLAVPEKGTHLDQSRPKPTDGLIQLNDVFGQVDGPHRWDHTYDDAVRGREPALDDVDAIVETVVGNSGSFPSGEFRVDAWPDAITYLATQIVEVRDRQAVRLVGDFQRLGRSWEETGLWDELRSQDAKVLERAESVGRRVVEVVGNYAPRTSELEGQNGSTFYAGLTENGVIVYAQASYLRDLMRDARIIELHRVLNEQNSGLWPDGHQFRSAEVANTRSIPESRELIYSYEDETALKAAIESGTHEYGVAEQDSPVRVVWVDKFGNTVLRLRDPEAYDDMLVPGNKLTMDIEGFKPVVHVSENLDGVETGQAAIFKNPATKHPRYVELAIKLNDPIGGRFNALGWFREAFRRHGTLELRDLGKLHIELGS